VESGHFTLAKNAEISSFALGYEEVSMLRFTPILIACALAGCNQREASSAGPKSPGRYAGIGTFDAGRLWQEMKGAPPSQDKSAASLADDEHVIVVLDSHTGEIRQCGHHKGFCVSRYPWTAGARTAATPVTLTQHATDLAAQDNAVAADSTKN
jgi:hypothetical protein